MSIVTKAVAALGLAMIAAGPPPRDEPLKAGDRLPPMALEQLLQAPKIDLARRRALRGQVVVIEFWATSCGPCVAAIPHLNALADQFAGRKVVFLSIAKSAPGDFLQERPIHTWIGVDTDGSVFDQFGVKEVPQTILVDRRGRIAAITYPTAVTAAVIEDLLAGKRVKVGTVEQVIPVVPADAPTTQRHVSVMKAGEDPLLTELGQAQPLALATLRETVYAGSGGEATGAGGITLLAYDLRSLLAQAYGVAETRVVVTAQDAPRDRLYDLIVRGADCDAVRPVAQRMVEDTFKVRAHRETREVPVWVLSRADNELGPGLSVRPTAVGAFAMHGGHGAIHMVNGDRDTVRRALEDRLHRPVIDETDLAGVIDLNVTWNADDPETLTRAIQEQLGLKLTPDVRPVELLVVEAQQP